METMLARVGKLLYGALLFGGRDAHPTTSLAKWRRQMSLLARSWSDRQIEICASPNFESLQLAQHLKRLLQSAGFEAEVIRELSAPARGVIVEYEENLEQLASTIAMVFSAGAASVSLEKVAIRGIVLHLGHSELPATID